ncbi:MAG: anthranilate phosphoribosyltransferase [Dehalococcoidales bacterium]|nr:MAG: anthranilate phosphoribosyltransferase [Dehalococcoidales bacterium]
MIKEAISMLVDGKSMNTEEAAQVMEEIMTGEVTPAQFGAFVTALRLKGETVEEITGLARTMRNHSLKVEITDPVTDVVGTGGDGCNTFNISTTVAFVVAGAGVKIAKHGNRAASSLCGAADVLEALGVKIDLTPEQVKQCLEEVGIGFMFAAAFHPAMKYAGPPRREIGIRTVFNILGPLTNPANAGTYLLGVADSSLVETMAKVLQSLGCKHALVVHGEDGLDEITITANTRVCEVTGSEIKNYEISPEGLGFTRAGMDSLKGGTSEENAALLKDILRGKHGPQRDIVLMNAAAALVAGRKAFTLKQGVEIATESIDSGKAAAKLDSLVNLTSSFS